MCKKFKKSLGRPKVSLPKAMDFNEIVSLDCKQFGKQECIMDGGYIHKVHSGESIEE